MLSTDVCQLSTFTEAHQKLTDDHLTYIIDVALMVLFWLALETFLISLFIEYQLSSFIA